MKYVLLSYGKSSTGAEKASIAIELKYYTLNEITHYIFMELLFLVLPLFTIFYLIGIPIWLSSLSKKVKFLEQQLEGGTVPAKPIHPGNQPIIPLNAQQKMPPPKQTVPQPQAIKTPAKPVRSFEEQIGGHLFQWLGIGALIIALVVFLKWSFDNGLIGETGRIVLGYLLVAAGLLAGDLLRKRYGTWSLAFTGGASFASYIVTWIAMNQYQMIGTGTAFTIYVLTAFIVCLLSMRYNAKPLAAFGILGGFITPILAWSNPSYLDLLAFILILDLATLALGHMRQWRGLNLLTFFGTALYQIFAIENGSLSLSTGLIFATIFTTIYLLVPAVYNIVQKQKSDTGDITILIGNGLLHFGIILWWLENYSPDTREFYNVYVALTFAVLFLVWSMGLYKRNKADTPLVLSGLSLTILFSSIAIPMQLGAEWTSVAWSIEAAFLLWLSLTMRDSRIANFAWPVMAASYIWYFLNPLEGGRGVFFGGSALWIYLLWALMFVVIAFLALSASSKERSEMHLLPFVLIGGIVLTLALAYTGDYNSQLSVFERFIQAAALIGGSCMVLWKAKNRWGDLSPEEKTAFSGLGVAVQIVTVLYLSYEFYDAIRDKRLFASSAKSQQIMQVGISILWAVYGAITLVLGIIQGWKSIRLFSLVLLLVAIAKLTLVDFAFLGSGARIMGFTVLGVLLVSSSFFYQHNKDRMKSFFADTESPSS